MQWILLWMEGSSGRIRYCSSIRPFYRGGTIDELVADDTLHPECSKIFRIDKSDTDHTGKPLLLHTRRTSVYSRFQTGCHCAPSSSSSADPHLQALQSENPLQHFPVDRDRRIACPAFRLSPIAPAEPFVDRDRVGMNVAPAQAD